MHNALRTMLLCLSILTGTLLCSGQAHASWTEIAKRTETYDIFRGLVRIDTTFQDDKNPLEQFTLHHITRWDPRLLREPTPKGSVLLLPDRSGNFDLYRIGGEGRSLADRLALEGYDVYGLTFAWALLPNNACEDAPCSFAKNWGLAYLVERAEFAADVITTITDTKPVIGGFGLGGELATAMANTRPSAYSGLLLWESSLWRAPTNIDAGSPYSVRCESSKQLLELGVSTDSWTSPYLKKVLLLGTTRPNEQSPYSNLHSNAEVAYIVTGENDQRSYLFPGYEQYLAGNGLQSWSFAYSIRVIQLAHQLSVHEPIALHRDLFCSYAGGRRFVEHLDAFTAPILSLQSGSGIDGANDTLNLFTASEDIRVLREERFGFADRVTTAEQERFLIQPILDWLQERVLPRWE